jgi:hypothetical protein
MKDRLRIIYWGVASFRKLLVLPFLCFAFYSCEKNNLFELPQSAGKTVIIERPVDPATPFDQIWLNDDVNLVITQGTPFGIKLEGGENLLPGIETTIENKQLTISNTNRFDWLRSYKKKITAYVTLPRIIVITYNATSNLTCTDTIHESDSLTVSAVGGSGYIDLLINVKEAKLSIFKGCSADMKVKGRSGLSFIYSAGYGPFYCDSLRSEFLYMRTLSTNNSYVYAHSIMEYEIMGLGDIIYFGPPALYPTGTISGSGKLIKGN